MAYKLELDDIPFVLHCGHKKMLIVSLINFTWLVTWNVIVIHRHIKEHLKEQYGFDDERANKYLKVSFTFTMKFSSRVIVLQPWQNILRFFTY